MPEIDRLLADWRHSVGRHFQGREDVLDELESHLHDAVELRITQGMPLEQAFAAATDQLGRPGEIGVEFSKVPPPVSAWLPVRIVQGCSVLLAILLVAHLVPRFGAGGTTSLVAVHMGLILLGYLSTLVVGAVGTSFLLARLFHDLKVGQKEYIKRAARFWSTLGVLLIGSGIALGVACPVEKTGGYYGIPPHQIGGIVILLWGLVMAGGYWRLRRSPQLQRMMLLGLGGNVAVILGWLGAVSGGPHSLGVLSSVPAVLLLVVCHLGIGCLAFVPTGCLRSRLP